MSERGPCECGAPSTGTDCDGPTCAVHACKRGHYRTWAEEDAHQTTAETLDLLRRAIEAAVYVAAKPRGYVIIWREDRLAELRPS